MALFFCLTCMLGMETPRVLADGATKTFGDYRYQVLADGTVEITGYTGTDTEISIPTKIYNKNVTSIGDSTFYGCSSLTSITIPDSVTSIGNGAFYGCRSLTGIKIPDSVTSMPDDNKDGTGGNENSANSGNNMPLETAEENKSPVPAKKGTVLVDTKNKCQVKVSTDATANPTVTYVKTTDKKTKKLTIPNAVTVDGITYKVTSIADNACKNNKKLTTVVIGKNVTKIGKNAFSGCKNVKKITLTAGKLKTISKNAFKGIHKKATITVKGTKNAKTALKKKLKKKSIGYVKTWKLK